MEKLIELSGWSYHPDKLAPYNNRLQLDETILCVFHVAELAANCKL